jgi:hypothetical protein
MAARIPSSLTTSARLASLISLHDLAGHKAEGLLVASSALPCLAQQAAGHDVNLWSCLPYCISSVLLCYARRWSASLT